MFSHVKAEPEDSKGKPSRWDIVSDPRTDLIVCQRIECTISFKDLRTMLSDGDAPEPIWETLPWKSTFFTYFQREKEEQINLIYYRRAILLFSFKFLKEALKISVIQCTRVFCKKIRKNNAIWLQFLLVMYLSYKTN